MQKKIIQKEDIEEIYPMSPMQQGMYFHTLYSPETGTYVEQLYCTINGELNAGAFSSAWLEVFNCHTVLRTAFISDGLREPVQVVFRNLQLPLDISDMSGYTSAEADEMITKLREHERLRGFRLEKPPLMRIHLIKCGEESYKLIWTFHHMLLDGWSLQLVFKEVLESYQSYCAGMKAEVREERPFRDYIVWLRRQDTERAREFWGRYLNGLTENTSLSKKTPDESSAEKYTESELILSTQETSVLKGFIKRHQLTMSSMVLGAWAVLLSRYTGMQDVLFGMTVSGRPSDLPGSEKMVGLFINTLPVRIGLNRSEKASDFLKRLKMMQIELQQYSFTQLSQIHKWSSLPRGQAMFDMILVYENYPAAQLEHNGSNTLKIGSPEFMEQTNYPLTVVAGTGDNLTLRIQYDCRFFEQQSVSRMLIHLKNLLTEFISDDGDKRVFDLEMLGRNELKLMLEKWNSTAIAIPERCVHTLIEEKASGFPDKTAVVFNGSALTYRQLNQRANQLAHYLRNKGLKPERHAAVYMKRCPDLIISMLAVLKSGGTYVPIDAKIPPERANLIIGQLTDPIVITHSYLAESIDPEVKILVTEQTMSMLADENTTDPENIANLRNPAYIIYTSGSTGIPKGVILEHRGLFNMTCWYHMFYNLRQEDKTTHLTSPGFDASIAEIIPCLAAGASLYIPDEDALMSPETLCQWLAESGITISFIPTPLAETLFRHSCHNNGHLRVILTGGDKLNYLPEKAPYSIINNYGPTECTVVATAAQLLPGSARLHIGTPVTNTCVYILDSSLRPVPVGVPGEIHISGLQTARGYLNRPELTAEKFIPDPFSSGDGVRMYRTGDLARYLPDGNIEILGRMDDQVKIRGFRIEPGEIEIALLRHPAVKQAVVTSQKVNDSHNCLSAYIVLNENTQAGSDDLRSYLKKSLPEYMIPSVFMMIDSLPTTSNGKVNRKALPSPDYLLMNRSVPYAPPTGETEIILSDVFRRVLGLEQVGIYDNFFELGGDSILSIQVSDKCRQAGIYLTPRQIFEHQTIAELAKAGLTRISVDTETAHAEQKEITGPVPLTPIQHWFFSNHTLAPHHWNTSRLYELSSPLDTAILGSVADSIYQHHDALRMRYDKTDSGWQQINMGYGELVKNSLSEPLYEEYSVGAADISIEDTMSRIKGAVLSVDLSRLECPVQSEIIEKMAMDTQTGFRLSKGGLMRFIYFNTGTGSPHRLLIVIHHLVLDAVSWRILMEDLQSLYIQAKSGAGMKLPEKTTSYMSWAEKLQSYSSGEPAESQISYWMDIIGRSHDPMPEDFPAQESLYGNTANIVESLNAEETEQLLHDAPKIYNTHISEILLTAVLGTMNEWYGARSIMLMLLGHGREYIFADTDLSRTIGWFTTIFPVHLQMQQNGIEALIASVKEQMRKIPENGIGYGILRYLRPDRLVRERMSGFREPRLTFNYLGQFEQSAHMDPQFRNAELVRTASESPGAEHCPLEKLKPHIQISSLIDTEFSIQWRYSTSVYRESTIKHLSSVYMRVLREIISQAHAVGTGRTNEYSAIR